MDGPWGLYAKWDKLDRERQIPYGLTNINNIQKNPLQIQKTDWWLPEAGGGGEMDERSQKVQTSSYKINKPWGCDIQQGEYSQKHFIAYLKIAKTANLKSSYHEKKIL